MNLATKKEPKHRGEFVRAGEYARFVTRDGEGCLTSFWVTAQVIGPDGHNGFLVWKADESRQVINFGSWPAFEQYTNLRWAGYSNLEDEDLRYLAQPYFGDRQYIDYIPLRIRELRNALPQITDEPSRTAITHDIAMFERLLADLDYGRELGPWSKRIQPDPRWQHVFRSLKALDQWRNRDARA